MHVIKFAYVYQLKSGTTLREEEEEETDNLCMDR